MQKFVLHTRRSSLLIYAFPSGIVKFFAIRLKQQAIGGGCLTYFHTIKVLYIVNSINVDKSVFEG